MMEELKKDRNSKKEEVKNLLLSKEKKMAEAEKRIRDKESQVGSELKKNKVLNDQLEKELNEMNSRLERIERKEKDAEAGGKVSAALADGEAA